MEMRKLAVVEPQDTEPQADLHHPVTGECVDASDLDAVAALVLRLDDEMRAMRAMRQIAEDILIDRASGTGRTQRWYGQRYEAKVEHPAPEAFDGAALRDLYQSGRAAGGVYGLLRVATVQVNLREYRKVRDAEIDHGGLRELRDGIRAAERPPGTRPRVTISEMPPLAEGAALTDEQIPY